MAEVKRVRCDRCGKAVDLDAPSAMKPTVLPDGWARWTVDGPLDVCDECREQVRTLLTAGSLVQVGHASQSGSGKSWTELGLERQPHPERWFPVYAYSRSRIDGRKGSFYAEAIASPPGAP